MGTADFALTTDGAVRLYSTAEVLRMPAPTWLIESVIPAGGLVGLIGPPGVGKTFIALDMALSVATGRLWQGLPTKKGRVLYISAEGRGGLSKRVAAWLADRTAKPSEAKIAWLLEAIPVHGTSESIDVLIERQKEELGTFPDLVIIDTLARCFEGDENQQEDMGRFVAGADRLREEFDATVLIVHHTRLDGERERGNTAFRGAADTMIFVAREPKHHDIVLSCNKQKEAEEFIDVELRLKSVPEHDSCVIGQSRASSVEQKKASMLSLLENAPGGLTWSEWFEQFRSTGNASKTTFHRLFTELRKNVVIIRRKNKYYKNVGHVVLRPQSAMEPDQVVDSKGLN